MKRQHAIVAFVLVGTCLCASAHESSGRPIKLSCPPDRSALMADVVRAIEFSDYTASPPARREMLARAREICSRNSSAVLTFVPPRRNGDAQLASK